MGIPTDRAYGLTGNHSARVAPGWLALALFTIFAAAPAHAEFTKVDGHDIYYETHGALDSGGTPVLLLHGGMTTIEISFSELLPPLAGKHPVIAIEQQGHGHTADRDRPVTLARMRRDTLGVLDHLEVQKVHVVGFSMGGMLGLELAVNAPERVATLSVLSSSANLEGMIPEIVKMNRDPDFRPSPEVAALLPTEEEFQEMKAGFAVNPAGLQGFEVMMDKLGKFIITDWGWTDEQLAAIRAPTLIAIGDRDFTRPEHAVHMAQTIPNARLAILPDTTHMRIVERPELIVPMIEDLITETGAAQTKGN